MRSRTLLTATGLLMAAAAVSQASSLSGDNGYFGIQFLKPSFNDERSISASTFYLTSRLATSKTTRFELGVPISRSSRESFASEIGVGNVYLGFENREVEKGYGVDVGVWLPTASEEDGSAILSGLFSDLNRWESFMPNIASARLGLSLWRQSPRGIGARFRMAPSIMIPTEGEADPEVFGMYSAHLVYQGERVDVSGGLLGRLWISDDELDFSERGSHQLELEATLKAQSARIGFVLFVPVDEGLLVDIVDYVLGFQVGAVLN